MMRFFGGYFGGNLFPLGKNVCWLVRRGLSLFLRTLSLASHAETCAYSSLAETWCLSGAVFVLTSLRAELCGNRLGDAVSCWLVKLGVSVDWGLARCRVGRGSIDRRPFNLLATLARRCLGAERSRVKSSERCLSSPRIIGEMSSGSTIDTAKKMVLASDHFRDR